MNIQFPDETDLLEHFYLELQESERGFSLFRRASDGGILFELSVHEIERWVRTSISLEGKVISSVTSEGYRGAEIQSTSRGTQMRFEFESRSSAVSLTVTNDKLLRFEWEHMRS